MSSGSRQRRVGRIRLIEFSARVLVPAAASLTLLAIVTEGGREVDEELQLSAPLSAAPGQRLPLRALFYAELHRTEGPRLSTPPVSIVLRGPGGFATTMLRPSYAHSLDGVLQVPAGLHGDAQLVATARVGADGPSVERSLRIEPSPKALQAVERALPPLRRLVAAPVTRLTPSQPVPSALSARISGGVCVPEYPCELFVFVGTPGAALAIVPAVDVSPAPETERPSRQTSGVVRLRLVTHGPEAQLTLAIRRDDAPIATRAVRLAVGLGVGVVTEMPRVVSAHSQLWAGLRGDERGCIVDAFREGLWLRSVALTECHGQERLPEPALEAGLWRLQLRRDPFSSDSAAVHSLYVRAAHETDAEVLRALALAALARDPSDPLARAVQHDGGSFVAEFGDTAGYLLAVLDDGLLQLPLPNSGLPRALLRQALIRQRVRTIALFALGLCALCLFLFVAQRGLSAASQAGRLMAEAGEAPRQVERQRLRMTLQVLGTVCSLLLAFLALAAYMVARSHGP